MNNLADKTSDDVLAVQRECILSIIIQIMMPKICRWILTRKDIMSGNALKLSPSVNAAISLDMSDALALGAPKSMLA